MTRNALQLLLTVAALAMLAVCAWSQPTSLPPVAYIDYQAQPRQYNELCMHAALCNALRAIEYQATGVDPGDLSLRFVGLSTVEEGWLESPDDPFGCIGAGRLAIKHGSCLSALCPSNANTKTPEAIGDAATRRTTGFVLCETMDDVRAAFASGPCAIGVNQFGHAWTWVAPTASGGMVVVDSYPDRTGRGRVMVWPKWYCEWLMGVLPDWEVVAYTGWNGNE